MTPPAAPTPSLAPLAITQGDPAGIGGEIIARAFAEDPTATAGCFVVGDQAHLERALAVVAAASPRSLAGVAAGALRVVPIDDRGELLIDAPAH